MLSKNMDLMLSENGSVAWVLKDLGLTELESKVYIFLAKSGIHKASDVSRKMNLHKAQVYHILKNLQNNGMVEATMESPMRFTAIPFYKVLDLHIKNKKGEIRFLEDKRAELIYLWSSIRTKNYECFTEKFLIIQGESNIYSKILQMIEDAENEVLVVLTKIGGTRSDPSGIRIKDALKGKKVRIKLMTCVSRENIDSLRLTCEEFLKVNHQIRFRHGDLEPNLIHFLLLKDNEELFFGITPNNKIHRENAGLWTNSKSLIHVLKMFFKQLWNCAMDV